MKTKRQKWQFERLFMHAGSLASAVNRLEQIARSKSTLEREKQALLSAVSLIKIVNVRNSQEESWKQYERST